MLVVHVAANVASSGHVTGVSRKLVATMPALLILGILAQIVILAAVIVLYVPCLIFPDILDKPYRWITRGMARFMTRNLIGRSRKDNPKEVIIP
jgi:uncharacterized membrane protein